MKNNILIIVENLQEYDEIIYILKKMPKEDNLTYFLFKTNNIFNIPDYYQLDEDKANNQNNFKKIFDSKNPFKTNFKTQSIFRKIITILINFPILFKIVVNEKIDFILSGVPLIFSRVLKLFFTRIIRIAYIRGLLFDSSKSTSISDWFYFLTKKIHIQNKIHFINNYYSEYILTTGEINKNFLINRGIPDKNIFLTGPLVLDCIANSTRKIESDLKKNLEVIFITQAFLWHLDETADSEQKKFLISLLEQFRLIKNKNIQFKIRLHPRDSIENYKNIIKKVDSDIIYDTSDSSLFLSECKTNKVIISGLSTFAFEWIYLGGKCFFYTSDYFFESSKSIYKKVNIDPYFDSNKMIQAILAEENKYKSHKMDNIFYNYPHGENVQGAVKQINKILNK